MRRHFTKRNMLIGGTLVTVLAIILVINFLKGPTKNTAQDNAKEFEGLDVVEVFEVDGSKFALVVKDNEVIFYDVDGKAVSSAALDEKKAEYLEKVAANTDPDKKPLNPEDPKIPDNPDAPDLPSTNNNGNEPSGSNGSTSGSSNGSTGGSTPTAPVTPPKPTDKVTYGSVEFIDRPITAYYIEVEDRNQPKGTSGITKEAVDGILRKEVRKVYINGSYSHTETVKEEYRARPAVHGEKWIGAHDPGVLRDDYTNEVIRLVNIERQKQGIGSLNLGNQHIRTTAQNRGKEIVTNFSHDGSNIWYAEAILKGSGTTPAQAVQGWLDSPGHRAILLSSSATEIGVGVFSQYGMNYYVLLIS